MMRCFGIFFILLYLGGCATVTTLYTSEPQGAAVYQDRQFLGHAPFCMEYTFSDQDKARGHMILTGYRAVWASGAEERVDRILVDPAHGSEQNFTFFRPRVPGRDIDVAHAVKLMRMRQRAEFEEERLEQEQREHRDWMRMEQMRLDELRRQRRDTDRD